MTDSRIRKFMRRRQQSRNYTLYGIIGGIVALLAVAMFVYPRYDRVQNFIRERANNMKERNLASGSYMRGSGRTNTDLRTENEIMDAGRTRTDNL